MAAALNVTVKMTCSSHIARAAGKTASCTAGPELAVQRLAEKLWGEGRHVCTPVQGSHDAQVWRIEQGATS